MYRKTFWILFVLTLVFMVLLSDAFSQYDYVPEMKKFPDIDITHYDLFAEFRTDAAKIKAKAVVEFRVKEAATNYVMFEIDRRVKILEVIDGEGNTLRFKQAENSDFVGISLAKLVKRDESARIELEYDCSFPLLMKVNSEPESAAEPRQGFYFFLRKWYPVNDYYCDQAPADFTFILPKNYEVLTSGQEISSEIQGDRKITRWESFGSSNYYFVFAGPFVRYAYEDLAPKIIIYMDTLEPHIAEATKQKVIDILGYYESLLCPYPYPVLYLVTTHSKTDPVGLNGLTYIDFEQFSQKYKYSDWTLSHELAHHWFGGVIRAKTPEDYCLLMESPAEYFSRLFIRSINGDERYKIDLEVQRMSALAGNEITPITKYYTLHKGGFLYAKGSYIFHMLRHIMGDRKFFGLMKKLIQEFYMKPVEIQDLQKLAEKAHGQSLKWFFEEWVYGTGIPEYELTYHINQKNNGKYEASGLITQKRVKFRMPIEIAAISSDKRYTHKIDIEHQENPFKFEFDFNPEKVLLDPEYKILRWDEDIKVWLYTSNGRKLILRKKYKEAERLLGQALKINSLCSWAALERANAAYLQEQYELAIQYYRQTLEGDLDFHMMPWPHEQIMQVLYLFLGISHDLLGKRQEAITWYQKVIEMGRNPRFAFYYDQAREYLKKPAKK